MMALQHLLVGRTLKHPYEEAHLVRNQGLLARDI